jgi:hypothetical protein
MRNGWSIPSPEVSVPWVEGGRCWNVRVADIIPATVPGRA